METARKEIKIVWWRIA